MAQSLAISRLVGVISLCTSLILTHGFQLKAMNADDGANNMCIDGRIAPELILIGAPRCSTTTFSKNFVQSPGATFGQCTKEETAMELFNTLNMGLTIEGMFAGEGMQAELSGCGPDGIKELHFFNANYVEGAAGKAQYLAHYPECQTTTRVVASDLTPSHHTMAEVPLRIADLYGTQANRLKFIALVRDPIRQMQSFYYYERQTEKQSFKDYVLDVLEADALGKHDKGNYGRYVNNANIASGVRNFLEVFEPWQIMIVPYKYNTGRKDGWPRLHEYVWDLVGISPPEIFEEADIVNSVTHPTLEEDLDSDTFNKLQALMDRVMGASMFAQTLANATGSIGFNLYGFLGDRTNAEEIEAWLLDGW